MIRAATSLILHLLTAPIGNEAVEVQDFATVDLGAYECRDIRRSTVIQRVCYDPAQRALLVGLGANYIRHCGVSAAMFEAFLTAPSMGQFYARNIAEATPDERFVCWAQRDDRRSQT